MNAICFSSTTIDFCYIDRSCFFHGLDSYDTESPIDKIAITDFGLFLVANNSTGGSLIYFYIFHFYSFFYLYRNFVLALLQKSNKRTLFNYLV